MLRRNHAAAAEEHIEQAVDRPLKSTVQVRTINALLAIASAILALRETVEQTARR